jgi:hypothetical protein
VSWQAKIIAGTAVFPGKILYMPEFSASALLLLLEKIAKRIADSLAALSFF